jgi:chromate reductase, NAD(P)H dehydrogenase (quinone)
MSNVITICGSLRKGSFNRMLANALPGLAPAGMTIKASPSIEMPLYNADVQAEGFPPAAVALSDAIRAADGVILVTPEYNYTIPGGLKNAIDWVSRMKDQPFAGKPVAIQSATGGPLGGGRMQYHVRTMLVFLDALAFNKPEIFVGMAQTKFDEKTGELKDEATRNIIKQQLEAFGKFIANHGGK